MKNTFLATLIAMLFALSFVSCEKDDDPKHVLYADSIVNALPFKIALNIDQWFVYLNESEGKDFSKIKPDDQGVVMLNADIAYKGGEFRKDSMIVVKDYPLVPVNKEIDKGSSTIYSVNYYIITEEVFRDIIAKMKEQGIEPEKYDEGIFTHTEYTFQVYNYANKSSFDIKLGDPFSTVIRRNENADIEINDGQNPKKTTLDCVIYYGDAGNGTAYSLEVRGYNWSAADEKSVKEGYNTTVTHYFVFTDELLESIKSFMAEKNVFPQETEFPKE